MSRVEIASMPWGVFQDRSGNALASTSVTVKNVDGSPATHWSAATGGSSATTALTADVNGTLPRFIDAGQYLIDVPSLSITGRRVDASPGPVDAVSLVGIGADPTGTVAADSYLVTALATGRPVDLGGPGNVFKITSSIVPPSGAKLVGEGATIDFSAQTGTFTAVDIDGTAGTPVNLAGNAAADDEVLNVSGSGFSDGDWAIVGSTAVTGTTSVPKGEIVRINSAASMTLYDPLCDSYATADTASVAKITPVEQIVIKGLYFKGPSDNTLAITGISMDRVVNVRVEDCTFDRTHNAAISVTDTVAFRVIGCHFKRIEKSGFAYGIALFNACQDVSIVGCTGHRLRHLVTHGGSTSRKGIPRRTITSACVASQCIDGGFDCHPGGEDVSFVGNTVMGSEQDGIIHQGVSGVISGNTVRNCARHGIFVQPSSVAAGEFAITGNKVRKVNTSTGYAIRVVTAAGSAVPTGVAVTGNAINSASTGIAVDASANAISYVTVTGNTVRGSVSHSVLLNTISYGTCVGNSVEMTSASVSGIYCRAYIDGTVASNVIKSASATSTIGIRVGTNAAATASTDVAVTGNRVVTAATGITLEATTTNCPVLGNNCRGCTTPITNSGGATNILTTADAAGAYNRI